MLLILKIRTKIYLFWKPRIIFYSFLEPKIQLLNNFYKNKNLIFLPIFVDGNNILLILKIGSSNSAIFETEGNISNQCSIFF